MSRSIALFVVLRAVAFAETGSLKGVVADSTGAIVPLVDVSLRTVGEHTPMETTKTDARGHFVLTAAPGAYELVVSAPGFEGYSRSVNVTAGTVTEVPTVSLRIGEIAKCEPGPLGPPTISSGAVLFGGTELYGTVTGLNGQFVARVHVTIRSMAKKERPTTIVTGPDGSFYFAAMAPGSYELRASRDGYSDFVIDRLELKAGQRLDIVEPLEMMGCPEGFHCEPNRRVHAIALCM